MHKLANIEIPESLFQSITLADTLSVETIYQTKPESIRTLLTTLKNAEEGFDFFIDLFGVDTGTAIDAVYQIRSLAQNIDLVIKVDYPYYGTLISVSDIYPATLMPERELCELFGLKLSGHPNPKRLLTTDGCDPFLLKDIPTRTAEEVRNRASQQIDRNNLERVMGSLAADDATSHTGDKSTADTSSDDNESEHLTLNMGPQHPSTHGVLHLRLKLDGELIVDGEAIIGQLHRGIEKLAESRKYNALGTLMDRGDYVAGIHGELAAALAVEKLLEAEVPARANWIRCLVGELVRIASHIVWYGTCTLDAGIMGLFLYTFKDREELLDILEELSGQRMMFNYIRPGGVVADITPRSVQMIKDFVASFTKRLDEHEEFALGNEVFLSRVRNVGTISHRMALDYGLSGANLRASGGTWDLRRDRTYAAYSELDFDIPTANEGDILARTKVRIEEMRQSLKMIQQCLDGMPEGDFMAKLPKALKVPAGEAYAAVESPKGELGVYIVSDGSTSPYRFRYRPPCLYALEAGEALLPGILIADAVVALGSLDFILGEIDR